MLNPAQEEIVELLGASRASRPEFSPTIGKDLQEYIDKGLKPLCDLAKTQQDAVFVNKHSLGQVMGCEKRFLAEMASPFEWSPALARGTVAHKAIELSVHWEHEADPLTLVDEALARLSETDTSLGDYLQTITETQRAEMRAESNDRVVKFLECFPPLKQSWRPVTESRLRLEVYDTFVFSGKVDLTLGVPKGNLAGKVLIDLKTGRFAPHHIEDLRFYALIESIRVGTPPRRTASYYLDEGKAVVEDITVEVLFAAASRLIDGTTKIVELVNDQREPNLMTGPNCRWCPALQDCERGQASLEDETYDEFL